MKNIYHIFPNINTYNNINKYVFHMPFYNSKYTNIIQNITIQFSKIKLLTNFINFINFFNIINQSSVKQINNNHKYI